MAAATKEPKKVKKGFKMPHLFWIMICLLFVSSLADLCDPRRSVHDRPRNR